ARKTPVLRNRSLVMSFIGSRPFAAHPMVTAVGRLTTARLLQPALAQAGALMTPLRSPGWSTHAASHPATSRAGAAGCVHRDDACVHADAAVGRSRDLDRWPAGVAGRRRDRAQGLRARPPALCAVLQLGRPRHGR